MGVAKLEERGVFSPRVSSYLTCNLLIATHVRLRMGLVAGCTCAGFYAGLRCARYEYFQARLHAERARRRQARRPDLETEERGRVHGVAPEERGRARTCRPLSDNN